MKLYHYYIIFFIHAEELKNWELNYCNITKGRYY